MESAVEALKMAAAVLIFIIAIASSFSLFDTAKETADSIIRIRDKQGYLQSADLDGGILYTSASAIRGEDYVEDKKGESSTIMGVTRNGDRLVEVEDIISTIYRYSIENYGVTIMKKDGTIIARYDSDTERVMNSWYTIDNDTKNKYVELLNKHTKTDYVSTPGFDKDVLERLYRIKISGRTTVGSPWYGNETEIKKRIACDIAKDPLKRIYTYNTQIYEGQNILDSLDGKIVEVINEVDNSTYLKQTDNSGNPIVDEHGEPINSNLLQQYEMPTIEVIYIIL